MALYPIPYTLYPRSGFTMIELLVVAAILSILFIIVASFSPRYLSKARDTRLKDDLRSMKTAFEEYATDKDCYPDPSLVSNCGSSDLQPYLPKVLCDKTTNTPYTYVRDSNCNGFQLFGKLINPEDPDIAKVGCESGCGPGGAYNYGVAGGSLRVTD